MKTRSSRSTFIFLISVIILSLAFTSIVLAGKPPKDPPSANHLLIVDKDGKGDFTDPVEAVNSITDATATNPYLIKINPGVYDIGTSSLQMQSFVDIEGSGQNVTKITGSIDENLSAVVVGASDAEIRDIMIENSGAVSAARAIYNEYASPKITNVTAIATGASGNIAIWNRFSSPTLVNVEASASGGIASTSAAISSNSSSGTLINVTASSDGARTIKYNNGSDTLLMRNVTASSSDPTGTAIEISAMNADLTNAKATAYIGLEVITTAGPADVVVNNSELIGTTAILNGTNGTIKIANTEIDGIINNFGVMKCVSVYNSDYDPITCP